MAYQGAVTFVSKFYRSIRRREFVRIAYLSYHYIRLFVYGLVFQKNFVSSHSTVEMTILCPNSVNLTGNFPSSPWLIRKLLQKTNCNSFTSLIDVGCGSGLVLFEAYRFGVLNLTGVEHGKEPAMLALANLNGIARVIHGDAFDLDYRHFEVICFYNPFREGLALRFFEENLRPFHKLITVNHDPVIEPFLFSMGFVNTFSFFHPLYKNFNGHVWLHQENR